MGMGFNGHRCNACQIEWNTIWSSVTMQFPKYECPKCHSKDIIKLKHIVPFAMPKTTKTNEHQCICGNTFEMEGIEITCPNCHRNNVPVVGSGWFVVPPNPDGWKEFGKAITRLSDKDIEDIINRP